MQHTIPLDLWREKIGPQIVGMAHAVDSCVHCGFCLPVCPTYQVLGEEMDSPRGRISLMKSALEGSLVLEDTLPYIDRCLGCLACCPRTCVACSTCSPIACLRRNLCPT